MINGEKYNEKVDTWSLGMILYQMCTLITEYEEGGGIEYIQWYSKDLNTMIRSMLMFFAEDRGSLNHIRQICAFNWGRDA